MKVLHSNFSKSHSLVVVRILSKPLQSSCLSQNSQIRSAIEVLSGVRQLLSFKVPPGTVASSAFQLPMCLRGNHWTFLFSVLDLSFSSFLVKTLGLLSLHLVLWVCSALCAFDITVDLLSFPPLCSSRHNLICVM